MAFLSGAMSRARGQMGRSSFAPGRTSSRGAVGRALHRAQSRPSSMRSYAKPMRMGGFGNPGFSGTVKPMRSGGGFFRQPGQGPVSGFSTRRQYGVKKGGRCG